VGRALGSLIARWCLRCLALATPWTALGYSSRPIKDPRALLDHTTARYRGALGPARVPERGGRTVSALAWRSLCHMPLCDVGVELGLLREQSVGGTVHLHRDLVERTGQRVMRKANPHNVL
jgi:hypothetical protein